MRSFRQFTECCGCSGALANSGGVQKTTCNASALISAGCANTDQNGKAAADHSSIRADASMMSSINLDRLDKRVYSEPMTRSLSMAVIAASVLLASAGVIAAYYGLHRAQSVRETLVNSSLLPLVTLVKDNQALLSELEASPYAEKDAGILESYLLKIRSEGVSKNNEMKQKLDILAENNTAIVAFAKTYAPFAKTDTFNAQTDKFGAYTAAWRDRWNSVMELYMAGGNYAAAGPTLPKDFSNAVEAEVSAAKH